jgi:predicted amidophosphoribosyltransferase
MQAAITLNPRWAAAVAGKPVLLVDDVMTSGATLAAATEACLAGGASTVSVLVLARVAKED